MIQIWFDDVCCNRRLMRFTNRDFEEDEPGIYLDTGAACNLSGDHALLRHKSEVLDKLPEEMAEHELSVMLDDVAALSVGMVEGGVWTDLDYVLDSNADVDMNVVMTGGGQFVEIQGTGEEATFGDEQLQALLKLARRGIKQLTEFQRTALGKRWPW